MSKYNQESMIEEPSFLSQKTSKEFEIEPYIMAYSVNRMDLREEDPEDLAYQQ